MAKGVIKGGLSGGCKHGSGDCSGLLRICYECEKPMCHRHHCLKCFKGQGCCKVTNPPHRFQSG